MKDHAADAAISAIASKATVGGGVTAVWGGITANHIAAIGGLLVAVVGLLVNAYYKHREDRRREDLYRLEVNSKLLRPYESDSDG